MKYIGIFFAFILLVENADAQLNYTNRWYFGHQAGLDFSSGSAVAITGSTNVDEGTATICDAAGNVLFYSDGRQIWNANNQIMQNGNGIMGGAGSSQQAPLIIKSLSSPTQYYLFTIGDHVANFNEFRYTVVDMCLAGGLGDVVSSQKNILIGTNYTERLVAVRKANNNDLWLITNKLGGNQWDVFTFSATGLNMTPQVSNVGPQCGNEIGWMKMNHAGNKIAYATTFNPCRALILFDFDNATGSISNPVTLNSSNDFYGVEFSPNDSLVYSTDVWYDSYIFQYDVYSGASFTVDFQPMSFGGYYQTGALQLGPDRKIYVANFDSSFISCINNPDVFGAGCNFVKHAVNLLPGTTSKFGLNVAFQGYVIDPDSINDKFTDTLSCNLATFNAELTTTYDSVKWNFGEPASGGNNIAGGNSVSHVYAAVGSYEVTMVLYSTCKTDTITKSVNVTSIGGIAPIQLGSDTGYCGTFSIALSASDPATIWSTGATALQINVNAGGTYWASFTNSCGTVSDTIRIAQSNFPILDLGNDTSLCNSQTLVLNAANSNSTYHWQDNSIGSSFNVSAAGTYAVTVTNSGGCQSKDTIAVSLSNLFLTITTSNTSCGNANGGVIVNALTGAAPFTYIWSNSQTNDTISNLTSGIYSVTVLDAIGCSSTAGAQVNSSGAGSVMISATDTLICSGDSVQICASGNFASYLWNMGQTTSCIHTTLAGNYYVTATDAGNCSATSNRLAIWVYPQPPVSVSINGDTIRAYDAVSYQWYLGNVPILGDTFDVFIAPHSGSYTVAVTDSNGCRAVSTAINIVSGISTPDIEKEITIYPNPVSSGYAGWQLGVSKEFIGSLVRIFDMNGRLVYSSSITQLQSDIVINAEAAIYLMRITSGHKTFTHKLIKL